MPKITIAHSPDADDIFMYYAIKFGWVNTGDLTFENIALDIETLNVEAMRGTYDATAISFGAYPIIRDDYALLRCAMSFGEGYGPKLVKKKGAKLKKNFKVALSGRYTTNAMLFRIAYPDARPVYMNFLEIEKAVLDGVVDAGVLIHEAILTYSDELEVEREIFDIWQGLARDMPLPLGGMAIRRSIPLLRAIKIENILLNAVTIAVKNKETLSRMLLERDLIRVDAKKLEKYLSMYANERSETMDDEALAAIDKLFEIGYNHGIYDKKIRASDMLIPKEYMDYRFS
ncbi:MAG: succinate--CoA ligase [Campylobacteraceae bacterium]|jgi:1,4-dihydroxy-6-naphthoate synthase|nr:succinate--CoA ligase [Campylobacteraceae bacterium]